jgi:hypothetical protein
MNAELKPLLNPAELEGKRVHLSTDGRDRGMRKIEKTDFGWAAVSQNRRDWIDLKLATTPTYREAAPV